MKKNNFFIGALLGTVVLSGVSFEARGMDASSVIFAGAGLVAAGLLLKNSEPVQTYGKHKARLAHEKELFDNSIVHAEPLEITGLEPKIQSGNEKVEAYLKRYEAERNAYNQKTKKNEYWDQTKLIDSYVGENQ